MGVAVDLVKASKLILNTAYTCANIPLAARSFVLYKRYYGAVKKIRSIRNKYDGDRCFVLGNGPSLNMVDLNKLVGKKIITVNMLYRHSFYEKLNPIFHCAIDQVMYRDEVGRTFLEVIKNHGNTNFLVSTNAPNELKALPNTYQTI